MIVKLVVTARQYLKQQTAYFCTIAFKANYTLLNLRMRLYHWLFLFSCFLGLTVLVSKFFLSNDAPPPVPLTEEYDVSFYRKLRSVSDLLSYVDTTSNVKDKKSLAYAEALSNAVRKRFFHNYSYYSLSENWGAALAGKLVWRDLGAIVVQDDIMKHPMAACSQQSIVLLTCFKQLGVPFRAVRFAHHFAAEGMFDGKWYYFDTDKEPHFPHGRTSVSDLMKSGDFALAYDSATRAHIGWWVGKGYPHYDPVNVMPAPRARLFQHVTKWASNYGFFVLALLLLFLANFVQNRKQSRKYEQSGGLWKKRPATEMT